VPWPDLLILVALGLFAGLFGGLLGVGGSIVMIPVLTLVLGRNQHLSQAAAMIVNVFVAIPAMIRHQRARAVRWDVMARMVPFGLVLIIVGVETSNVVRAGMLEKLFGLFLAYVVAFNVHRLFREERSGTDAERPRAGWVRVGIVGGLMGLLAGLLGIGGGLIAVPLLQRVCRLPLRQSIATSSAAMCLTSIFGAIRKNATLSELTDAAGASLGLDVRQSLLIAACLIPTAMIGSLIGAGLVHSLALRWVRVAFILLMGYASLKMLGIV
jgi:uncharacterized membrane protein YfcA